MKFEKDTWRCEIEGAADMPMRALYDLYEGIDKAGPVLARVVKGHNLTDWDGQPATLVTQVEVLPGKPNEDGTPGASTFQTLRPTVSVRQLKWLRDCVEQAAKDEMLDPEV